MAWSAAATPASTTHDPRDSGGIGTAPSTADPMYEVAGDQRRGKAFSILTRRAQPTANIPADTIEPRRHRCRQSTRALPAANSLATRTPPARLTAWKSRQAARQRKIPSADPRRSAATQVKRYHPPAAIGRLPSSPAAGVAAPGRKPADTLQVRTAEHPNATSTPGVVAGLRPFDYAIG